MKNYPTLVEGYKKWWGRKQLQWFDPHNTDWSGSGVNVRVNPELGLEWNGTPHLVKLYMKSEGLSKSRVDIITHLMEVALRGASPPNTKMAVLDVRRNRLVTPTVPIPALNAALRGELAYIAAIWNQV